MPSTDIRSLRDLAGRIDHLRRGLLRAFDEAGDGFDLRKVRSVPGDTPAAKLDGIKQIDQELNDLMALAEAKLDLVGTRLPPASEPPRRSARKSVGERFIESGAYKRRGQEVAFDVDPDEIGIGTKAVLGSDASFAGVDGEWPIEPERVNRTARAAEQPPTLVQAVPTFPLGGWRARYQEETTATNGADPVEEGDLYPEPDFDLAQVVKRLRKIGVMVPVTEEILEDDEATRAYVNGRLGDFCRARVDEQLIDGDGTGQNLLGFHQVVGVNSQTYTAAGATPQDKIAAILAGAGDVASVGKAVADSITIEAAEWWGLLAATDSAGNFLFNPGTPPASLFGLRPIVTTNETAGRFLVGAMQSHSVLFTRAAIDIRTSSQHDDFFAREKTAIRAKLPAWLAVLRPAAFASVEGA